MLLFLAALCFAKSTQIDFDDLDVTAERPTPSVILVQDAIRSLCETEDSTSLAWQECVANLSYDQILSVCSSLGTQTPQIVNDLLVTSKPTAVYQSHSDGEILRWQGCLYNSETGPRVEHYIWVYTQDNWIMTDGDQTVYATDEMSSLTVFDGLKIPSDQTSLGDRINIPGTFAYLLVQSTTTDGRYVGIPAKNSQSDINQIIMSHDLAPPYCDGLWITKDCNYLPNMMVTSVTPWMMVVKTLMPDKVGYQVSGIFFQSITGYDYTTGE